LNKNRFWPNVVSLLDSFKSIQNQLLQCCCSSLGWILSVPKAAVAEAEASPRKAGVSMGAARVSDLKKDRFWLNVVSLSDFSKASKISYYNVVLQQSWMDSLSSKSSRSSIITTQSRCKYVRKIGFGRMSSACRIFQKRPKSVITRVLGSSFFGKRSWSQDRRPD